MSTPSATTSPAITGNQTRDVLRLAFPATMEQLLWTLMQMVVLMAVGHLGPEALTIVGISNTLLWFFSSGFAALGAGATALVARAIGADDKSEGNATARQALMVAIVVSLAVFALVYSQAEGLLRLMGLTGEVVPLGVPYLRYASISLIFSSISFAAAAILRGAGDTRTPLKINTVGAVVNVVLVNVLVCGRFGFPALGLDGAGIAYASYAGTSAVLFVAALLSGKYAIGLDARPPYSPDRQLIVRIVRVGLPAAGEQLLLSGGILMFSRIVASLGTTAFAAHQITSNITGMSWMPAFGFSLATTALVGQSLGRQDPDLAEEYARTSRRLVLYITTSMAVMFFAFGGYIARLYTTDLEVIGLAALCMRVGAVSLPAGGSYSVLAGGLRGAGDTRWPLYITFVAVWTIRLTTAYFMAIILGWGLTGIWMGIVLDQFVRTGLIEYRFRTGHWKTIKV